MNVQVKVHDVQEVNGFRIVHAYADTSGDEPVCRLVELRGKADAMPVVVEGQLIEIAITVLPATP